MKEQATISSSPMTTRNSRSTKRKRSEVEADESQKETIDVDDDEDDSSSSEFYSDQPEDDPSPPPVVKKPAPSKESDKAEEADFNLSQAEKKKRCKSANVATGATPTEKRKKRLTDKKFEQGKVCLNILEYINIL